MTSVDKSIAAMRKNARKPAQAAHHQRIILQAKVYRESRSKRSTIRYDPYFAGPINASDAVYPCAKLRSPTGPNCTFANNPDIGSPG